MSLFIRIWDVQHGSAAYVRTPTPRHIAIDLGIGDITDGSDTESPLERLRAEGVRQLDEVIITHPHRDHLDDIVDEFDKLYPRVLHRPRHLKEADIRSGNRPGDSAVLEKYFKVDAHYSHPVPANEDPEFSANNGGVDFAFFQPTESPTTNLNNHSIVTFITYTGTTVCIPGDNEAPSWNELLRYDSFKNLLRGTSIFVASHHGREAGYCADVFAYCSPILVIVSDGPASDTSAVAKYITAAGGWTVHSRSGAASEKRKVLTTRHDGTIEIDIGAEHISVSVE